MTRKSFWDEAGEIHLLLWHHHGFSPQHRTSKCKSMFSTEVLHPEPLQSGSCTHTVPFHVTHPSPVYAYPVVVCMCVCVPEFSVEWHVHPRSTLCFERGITHWTWSSLVRVGWLDHEPQRSSCLCLLSSGITGVSHPRCPAICVDPEDPNSSPDVYKHFTNRAITLALHSRLFLFCLEEKVRFRGQDLSPVKGHWMSQVRAVSCCLRWPWEEQNAQSGR